MQNDKQRKQARDELAGNKLLKGKRIAELPPAEYLKLVKELAGKFKGVRGDTSSRE
jgi:hypothetical protein